MILWLCWKCIKRNIDKNPSVGLLGEQHECEVRVSPHAMSQVSERTGIFILERYEGRSG